MKRAALLMIGVFVGHFLSAQTFYATDTIREIKIFFEEENWADLLDSMKQAGEDDRLVGDVIIDGVPYNKSGIRYKGNSSYFNVRKTGSSKLPFNIKVNYKKKKRKLPGGYATLKLSNIFRDPSFLREVLSYEIAGKYMAAPRANFVRLFVNDNYLGLYNCTESIDEQFLETYFGDSEGTFFKCDPNWHAKEKGSCPEGDKSSLMYLGEDSLCYMGFYEIKSDNGWGDLIELANVLNNAPGEIEQILNIDETLWMLAFNNVLVNLDSYSGRLCHNYYLYRDTFGIHHPVVWDMNLSLGGFRYTGLGGALSNEDMQKLSMFVHYKEKNPQRPLITNLLTIDFYRKIYFAHIRTILTENFSEGQYLKRAEEIHNMISADVEKDENKLYSFDSFKANLYETADAAGSKIVGIKELMEGRTEYLVNHPLMQKEVPLIEGVETVEDDAEKLIVNARIEGATNAWLMYRYHFGHPFKKVALMDDGSHDDQSEADQIWGASVDRVEGMQYYIIAENDKSAALLPERAAREFFEYLPDSQN